MVDCRRIGLTLIAGLCLQLLVVYSRGNAPLPLSFIPDAELLQRNDTEESVPPFLESSLELLNRRDGSGEPNFFWIGSGDGENGLTYWVTTTVFKTRTVLLTFTLSQLPNSATEGSVTEQEDEFSATLWPVQNSSCGGKPPEATTASTWLNVDPKFWIRTVFQTEMDETTPAFSSLVEQRLRNLYSKAAAAAAAAVTDIPQRVRRQATNETADFQVLMQNISRPFIDLNIHVIYALTRGRDGDLVEPEVAVLMIKEYSTRVDNIVEDLCTDGRKEDEGTRLCRSVIIEAEPYLAAAVQSDLSSSSRSWIIAAAFGATLLLLLLLLIVVLSVKKYKAKRTVGQGQSQPSLARIPTSQLDQKDQHPSPRDANQNLDSASGQPAKTSDPEDPVDSAVLVRKSRSTSRKRGRLRRPQTAPAFQSKSKSSSDLSLRSSASERTEFVKCCEESFQPSRGCRGRKKKRRRDRLLRQESASRDSLHPDYNNGSAESADTDRRDSIESDQQESLPSVHSSSRRSFQRLSLAHLDVVDETAVPAEGTDPRIPVPAPRKTVPVEIIRQDSGLETDCRKERWKPGSLVPSRVASAVAGTRLGLGPRADNERPVSTPAESLFLRNAVNPAAAGHSSRQAWVSSDSTTLPTTTEIPQEPGCSDPSGNLLHVHSQSYPVWPSLGPNDPAIELIRVIKDELKKFDSGQDKSF